MWPRLRNPDLKPQAESTSTSPAELAVQFSAHERRLLLRVAHESIAAGVDSRPYTPPKTNELLREPRGVFTTLYRDGHLRGCVGYVSAIRPLIDAVAETAQAAAFEDTRFMPVEAPELPHLEVSLSVLSPTFAITPEEIEIGKHGLVVRQHGRKGLLLPQVAPEHGWDVDAFLEQTCFKAGLPGNAWQYGAEIEAFTAEIFGDSEFHR